jgi:GNAT superfamily N-acetyltransferase
VELAAVAERDVPAEFRHGGLGRALVAFAEDTARDAGGTALEIGFMRRELA